MLILCYGITKSGSTLTFELVKGMLESAGHAQERLPDGVVNPGHRVNYVQPLDRKRLKELLSAVGDRWIAVKTHAGFQDKLFPYLEKLRQKRRIQIIASYRDPRDICLSLIDAGAVSRAKGVKEFSEVTDIATAVPRVLEQIVKFRKCASPQLRRRSVRDGQGHRSHRAAAGNQMRSRAGKAARLRARIHAKKQSDTESCAVGAFRAAECGAQGILFGISLECRRRKR